jgi:hypothetical protein
MGAGDKFYITWRRNGIGFGIYINRFPHQLSISIQFLTMFMYMGFGKGYDEQ